MKFLDAVKLVAAREVRVKLRDRAFLIGTLITIAVTIAGITLPSLIAGGPSTVAIADGTVAAALTAKGLEVKAVADDRAAEQLVRDDQADAAVVTGSKVLAMKSAPDDVVAALSDGPEIQLLDVSAIPEAALFLVPFFLALLYYITALSSGIQIAQSVVEEKQTRIIEILVASVPVRALLAGKVIGGSILALGQTVLFAVVAVIGLQIADMGPLLPLVASAIGWYIPFLVVGFLALAALWAAVGALVSRQEDLGGASAPMSFAVMIPFFAVLMFKNDPSVMTVLSYIPLSSPIAMPIRVFLGEAAFWEPFAGLGLLLLTGALFIAMGARIYEGSLLRTNGRTSIATAWKSRANA